MKVFTILLIVIYASMSQPLAQVVDLEQLLNSTNQAINNATSPSYQNNCNESTQENLPPECIDLFASVCEENTLTLDEITGQTFKKIIPALDQGAKEIGHINFISGLLSELKQQGLSVSAEELRDNYANICSPGDLAHSDIKINEATSYVRLSEDFTELYYDVFSSNSNEQSSEKKIDELFQIVIKLKKQTLALKSQKYANDPYSLTSDIASSCLMIDYNANYCTPTFLHKLKTDAINIHTKNAPSFVFIKKYAPIALQKLAKITNNLPISQKRKIIQQVFYDELPELSDNFDGSEYNNQLVNIASAYCKKVISQKPTINAIRNSIYSREVIENLENDFVVLKTIGVEELNTMPKLTRSSSKLKAHISNLKLPKHDSDLSYLYTKNKNGNSVIERSKIISSTDLTAELLTMRFSTSDLLEFNAFYEYKTTYGEDLVRPERIELLPSYITLYEKSPITTIQTLAHEMSHSIDPLSGQVYSRDIESAMRDWIQCFSKSMNMAQEQISETFADWFAAHLVSNFISKQPKSKQKQLAINSLKDFCIFSEGSNGIHKEELEANHPQDILRVNAVYATIPLFREIIGCSEHPSPYKYCSL